MDIREASFIMSNTQVSLMPEPDLPEYAFIGRSNVGKSSLINMLVKKKGLAKTSSKPGKTQLMNHFLVSDEMRDWYLVDLPGYGYASASKKARSKWQAFIEEYIIERPNLVNLFILIDSRHEPQRIDLEFLNWVTEHNVPFTIVFTKADKQSKGRTNASVQNYRNYLKKSWQFLPKDFVTSNVTEQGRHEVLNWIDEQNDALFSEDA